jgi:hypothetical protein
VEKASRAVSRVTGGEPTSTGWRPRGRRCARCRAPYAGREDALPAPLSPAPVTRLRDRNHLAVTVVGLAHAPPRQRRPRGPSGPAAGTPQAIPAGRRRLRRLARQLRWRRRRARWGGGPRTARPCTSAVAGDAPPTLGRAMENLNHRDQTHEGPAAEPGRAGL